MCPTKPPINVSDDALAKPFHLKSDGKIMLDASRREHLASTVNHLVHHRGQLTVFMRLKDIAVPSIYGPPVDDKGSF